jgi:hypothetical protein
VQVAKHFSTISINPLNRKRLVQQQELLLKVPLLQFWFSCGSSHKHHSDARADS